ncbi:conserved protein of unknown function [Methylorubrum extorquens]|uniref:Uncharacterized protein n=1 Tax=Methylorubrum extorquens TaxID=408 RepID=A0A2N9AJX9_METEX|nr:MULTISPECIES: hypothetical protein [Methylobacteriaceae]KQQ15952.1 hypothetical protein ASF56_23410 [Methylobacterium sp. Leaf122]WHQ69533.1 hypothetical protein KEC54_24875 [Methylorubrum extorquens]SOR27671.1 conserved protein of unknown function [Methylorubrum extorquens]
MPSNIDPLSALLRDPSSPFGAAFDALRNEGLPVAHVVHLEDTGQVLMADEDGQYRPAHGAIRQMVTGEPWRDPGRINPVPSYPVRHSPTRLAEHNAEVADMLLYLVQFYRPALAADPEIDDAIAEFVAAIGTPINRGHLVGLDDNYERWDVIAGNFFEYVTGEEGEPTAVAN